MQKKILLLSRDPGGANAILPMIAPLARRGYDIALFGKDAALKRYREEGLVGLDVNDYMNAADPRAIDMFLSNTRPDAILTGTSADDMTEKYIWKAAEASGIPSFALVDQWVNYGIRFSRYGLADMEMYYKHKNHEFLPTAIFATDADAKREMEQDGLPGSRISVTGNPYFEYFLGQASRVTANELNSMKNDLGIHEDDHVVTFISEPIAKMYGAQSYLGYTETTIVREVIEALLLIKNETSKRILLIIRLHPKDAEHHYDDCISDYSDMLEIRTDRSMRSYESILLSDVVCGMYSMMLLESLLLKKPLMSVQIGLTRENPFILARKGAIKTILNKDELVHEFRKVLMTGGNTLSGGFLFVEHPIENVITEIERHVCPN